ncbi:hypothetical protein [Nocardia flavorosea]|uniref:Secreted protein n=1 Tax=Nocardia flavorosea TaxID=53429 RepID=A0A846YNS9_9NOCA|nr:hypothetical protein [Nocardia flavorosea]NKY60433.1 hypothetical protein [Nocardia flavorosea]
MSKPLLYIDVDGPLNPFDAKPHRRPAGYETHRLTPKAWLERHEGTPAHRVKPLRVILNPSHGPKLLNLADRFDLMWATTWEHDANEMIGPRIGLPELPVVEWVRPYGFGPMGAFWKTAQLIEHADGRPFAWLDDDIHKTDREYVDYKHFAPALLHQVHPAVGLRDDDFMALADWVANLGQAAA